MREYSVTQSNIVQRQRLERVRADVQSRAGFRVACRRHALEANYLHVRESGKCMGQNTAGDTSSNKNDPHRPPPVAGEVFEIGGSGDIPYNYSWWYRPASSERGASHLKGIIPDV
jgi:hypothetical protein